MPQIFGIFNNDKKKKKENVFWQNHKLFFFTRANKIEPSWANRMS
jgi:hypothetical protein